MKSRSKIRNHKRQPKRADYLMPPIDRCPVCRELLYSTDSGKYCGKCGWSNIRGKE